MNPLLALDQLIVKKPRPETTLSLIRAVREQARELVPAYVFTDTIRGHITRILDMVATGRGQGFWVEAEYGAGKTHFLAVLAALLADPHGKMWELVQDEEVRSYARRLQNTRLFPVIVSLRGMGDADALTGRRLLDVLLEEGFAASLQAAGLAGNVQITAADDYIVWLEQTADRLREDVEAYIRTQTGRGLHDFQDDEGNAALARVIADYCQRHAITPQIAAGVRDRLAHVYRQITQIEAPGGQGRYNGLLVVIDEYEGWERTHPGPHARSADEDLLETIGYLLPHDLGYQVYTVVASQSSAPAKLLGGAEGDRYINIPLLATHNEHDYDVIVAHRVRGLNEQRVPEIEEHYDYCKRNFEFAANLKLVV